jgi:hypothetical protein
MYSRTIEQRNVGPLRKQHTKKTSARRSRRAVKRGTISYHSFDSVNLDTLRSLAEVHGLHVEYREPRDGLGAGLALLIDADFWWTDQRERRRGLRALVEREVRPPVVGVHGWQLDDEQVAWLRQNGIHVSNKLDDEFIEELAKCVASIPPGPVMPRPTQ